MPSRTPNSHDPPEARKFKGRARARQETFNARVKTFACLEKRFHYGLSKQKITFEAVCVIAQHQMENGSPLFQVWTDEIPAQEMLDAKRWSCVTKPMNCKHPWLLN
jgi:hypothetical protein